MLCVDLIEELRARRDYFNGLFNETRWRFPQLSGDSFTYFLKGGLNPVVAAVAGRKRSAVGTLVEAGYTIGIELVSQNLVGPAAVNPWLNRLWQRLPELADWLLCDPAEVIAPLCNICHHVGGQSGSHPQQWLDDLLLLAPLCNSVNELLTGAQLAAWRAGLAHYRHSALEQLAQFPPQLAGMLFTGSADVTATPIVARLQDDPWYDPTGRRLLAAGQIAVSCGAFLGFGGEFCQPPQVCCSDQRFYALCAGHCWLLSADIYGATLQRTALPITIERGVVKVPPAATVIADRLRDKGYGELTSACSDGRTLALTTSLCHAVQLVVLS